MPPKAKSRILLLEALIVAITLKIFNLILRTVLALGYWGVSDRRKYHY
jgi:hypothetical protein